MRAAVLEENRTREGPGFGFIDEDFAVAASAGGDVWTACLRVHATGRREHCVTDRLGIEAFQRKPPEQTIRWIPGDSLPVRKTLLAECGRAKNRFEKSLLLPAVAHESGGEEFEKLGMRRFRAADSQIIGSADDSGAETILPDAIDRHASQERGLNGAGFGDPSRPCEAAAGADGAGLDFQRFRVLLEKCRKCGLDKFAGSLVVASL